MRFAASGAQRGDDAGGEVLDVDEAAALLPSPAIVSDSPSSARSMNVATTPAARARGP